MRILLIHKFHYRLGGAERIYFDTARLLEAAGHEVAFFSMEHPENQETQWSRFFVERVEYGSEMSLGEKIRTASRIIWNFEVQKKLQKLIDEFRPDAAHCFNVFHQLSPSVLWTLRKNHIPTVLTLCDFKVVSPNYFLYHFEKREIWNSGSGWRCIAERCVKNSHAKSLVCAVEKWSHDLLGSYRLVNVFLAPSQFLIDKYHELGFDRDIDIVHHPVVKKDETVPLAPIPFSERANEYLYFGRFSVEKGVDTIIRAFEKLPPESRLLLVGYGPEEESLRALVKELGLERRVQFLGAVYGEELATIMRRVRAIILSSVWYENQPFVMMDSLAAGTLLVASRIGGIPDILKNGKNGLLYEPGNADDLARVIQSIPEHDYMKMIAAARETASEYTDEHYLKDILAAYKKASAKEKLK
ncbi:MAG: glycosyltransferase [Candidatus Moraniibacteriota bacterium]